MADPDQIPSVPVEAHPSFRLVLSSARRCLQYMVSVVRHGCYTTVKQLFWLFLFGVKLDLVSTGFIQCQWSSQYLHISTFIHSFISAAPDSRKNIFFKTKLTQCRRFRLVEFYSVAHLTNNASDRTCLETNPLYLKLIRIKRGGGRGVNV